MIAPGILAKQLDPRGKVCCAVPHPSLGKELGAEEEEDGPNGAVLLAGENAAGLLWGGSSTAAKSVRLCSGLLISTYIVTAIANVGIVIAKIKVVAIASAVIAYVL